MNTSTGTIGTTSTLVNNSSGMAITEALFAIAMILFFILLIMERLRPYQRYSNKISKESFVTNTTAFLVNNIILAILRASSLFFVAQQFSTFGLLSGMPDGPTKWLICFLLFDLAIYAWHFASHKYEFLWRFHKIHHSDKSINVSTGFRFHVFDLLLEIFYKCLFVILVGVNAYVVLAIEVVELFFVFFHHANVTWPSEHAISQVIITPSLHRVHHSALRSDHDSNYGIVLSIWDRLFGTRKELVPEKIGLDLLEAQNFIQLFSLAFITETRMRKLLHLLPKGKK